MMRKRILALAILLFCCGVSFAATVNVGGKTIPYRVPEGFVSSESSPELMIVREFIKTTMPPDQETLAMYVDSSVLASFERTGNLERYFLINTSKELKNRNFRLKDFAELKKGVLESFGDFSDENIKGQVDKTFSDMTDGALRVNDIQPFGCYAITDSSISWVMLLATDEQLDDGVDTSLLAMVCTILLTEGKIVAVNQYKSVLSAEGIDAFKEEAQQVVSSMAFPAPKRDSLLGELMDSFLGRVVRGGVIGGIIGGLVAFVVARLRKKK